MSDLPIGEFFLSDCHSAALVSRAGSVDWLCLPRFGSPSVFARLLDDAAGHWSITAPAATGIQRAYAADSLVLRTEFTTATGTVTLTDALALGEDNRGHQIGARAPHLLLRLAECEQQASHSYGSDGRRSSSTSPHEVQILEPARLRTLPFGTAMLLLRSAPPIVLTLSPWTARTDAAALTADRTRLEEAIQHAHTQSR